MGIHKLIIIAGNTGSGKTTLAERLAKDTGIRFVEVNQFTLGYPSRLIFESTGLGGRTRDVSDMYPTKLVIKCVLPHDIAIENRQHRQRDQYNDKKRSNKLGSQGILSGNKYADNHQHYTASNKAARNF